MADPRLLHQKTVAVKPNTPIKPTTIWVAVLKPEKSPNDPLSQEDFLWIKCTGTTTIGKIHEQWVKRYPSEESFVLKFGPTIPDTTMSVGYYDTHTHNDGVVVFQATKPAPERQPLKPSNTQVPLQVPIIGPAEYLPPLYKGSKPLFPNLRAKGDLQDENAVDAARNDSRSPASFTHMNIKAESSSVENRHAKSSIKSSKVTDSAFMKISRYISGVDSMAPSEMPSAAQMRDFPSYVETWREEIKEALSPLNDAQVDEFLGRGELEKLRRDYHEKLARMQNLEVAVKPEEKHDSSLEEQHSIDETPMYSAEVPTHTQQSFQLQRMLIDAPLYILERGVDQGVRLLEDFEAAMLDKVEGSPDAAQWIQQIDTLRKQAVKTKTVIGVVGNTGAGKSSVINAMLDEERLVPTNCMRACTAVVTEISYNYSEESYRAQIEFIAASDWERELGTLFQDITDGNGNISRDCSNEDTDAGIAYAKIKAVYPGKTKEDIVNSDIQTMLQEVSHILGKSRDILETDALQFYKRLQHFVDSSEKSTGSKDKEQRKGPKEREFWPLIRVVRIYVKSLALSTGAVIVDLPGVHDANAARAAVAEGYMKQCTGLWIVAPINRAVDDKAAKSLLGESFKRQLKMDGGFGLVTFICSKTDDISLMEAQDSLGLDEEMGPSWEEIDLLSKKQKNLKVEIDTLKDSKVVYGEVMNDVDEQLEVWEALREEIEDGKTIFAPPAGSPNKKRKNNDTLKARKKQCRFTAGSEENGDDDADFASSDDEAEDRDVDEDEISISHDREPLTEEQLAVKIAELRATKKQARKQRAEFESIIKTLQAENRTTQEEEKKIQADMSAMCIAGRNQYSKGAIQLDYAAGIKELDQELAAEDDEENFNPDNETRDYEEIARKLPVFCVSSRGYQKLQGRLRKDPAVPGFKTTEETEIPQLQAHCKQLTEAGRIENCRRFLNNLSQLLNSLSLWASNDGTSANMTPEERARGARHLQRDLKKLESGLNKVVENACKELAQELQDNIFDRYDTAISNAADQASHTASKWGAPVNRENRAAGGVHFMTYKAICRRMGVYTNAQGPHEWNVQLLEPMMKVISAGWEKTFSRRTTAVMAGFARNAAMVLREFHRDVNVRAGKVGASVAGLAMLQQQLQVYENILKDVSTSAKDTVHNNQKEINREFTPVIERAMEWAYETCVQERGTGSYMRMKTAMNGHVSEERHTMFQRAADEVKNRLRAMIRSVEDDMNERADAVFVAMGRDYHAVLSGRDVTEGVLPKVQRTMRQQVMSKIDGVEKMFRSIVEPETSDNEADAAEGASAQAVGRHQDDMEDGALELNPRHSRQTEGYVKQEDGNVENVSMDRASSETPVATSRETKTLSPEAPTMKTGPNDEEVHNSVEGDKGTYRSVRFSTASDSDNS